MSKTKTVILDVDGTLVRLPIDWNKVKAKILELSRGGVRSFLGFVARYHGEAEFWAFNEFMIEEERKALNHMEVLDNAKEFIENICERYRIILVSMQSRVIVEEIVRRLGLEECIDFVLGREDGATRIEQISKVLNALKVGKEDVVFIGDKVLDVIAAIVNGIKGVLIVRGMFNPRISDTDDLEEDLEVLGIPITKNLKEIEVLFRELFKA